MTKDTSHKKVEANRRNALRSTGPKTTEGKRAVRHNAVKHGILTKDIVVNVFDGAEDKEEFDELLQRLKDDLQPYGILEQAQVERIAICYWRLRRAIRAESGDLGKQLNFIKLEKAFQNKQTFVRMANAQGSDSNPYYLQTTSMGLDYLIRLLKELREVIEISGALSEEAQVKLVEKFGKDDLEGITYKLIELQLQLDEVKKANGRSSLYKSKDQRRKSIKEAMLKFIDEQLPWMGEMKEVLHAKEMAELEAEVASRALPFEPSMNRIFRYETTIERQLYRAMNELEGLQRRRRGDNVPPPIKFEVAS